MGAMLSAIRTKDGRQVVAGISIKNTGPFSCPSCKDGVVLRSGTLRLPHFAHKAPVTCSYGKGETEGHRRCKTEIYEALLKRADVSDVVLERPLGEVRPDISAVIRGVRVAIEVQISALPIETVIHRTKEYAKRQIALLWLSPWTPALDGRRYSPRAWERWFHAAYFGQVYYWKRGLTVIPYRFTPHLVRVPKKEWRDEDGALVTAKAYDRRSRRFRKAVAGQPLHLVRDFAPLSRGSFQSKELEVPVARLFGQRKGCSRIVDRR
jgi:competence protein CoiA